MPRGIADLKVRVRMERDTFDSLLDEFGRLSEIAEDMPWHGALQESVAGLGMALGRARAELVDGSSER